MLPVEIGSPDAAHAKEKLREGEVSVAINITSLHRLLKILSFAA